MSYRLLASGAFVCALTLLNYAGAADAARLVPNGASSLIILAAEIRASPVLIFVGRSVTSGFFVVLPQTEGAERHTARG